MHTGLERLRDFPVIRAEFKMMGMALSGLQVDKSSFDNLESPTYKGLRAVTRSGDYGVRS